MNRSRILRFSKVPRVNMADALMEVVERSLAGGASVRPAAERHQVVIHAEADALAGEGDEAGCAIEDGPAICSETARRLACDASLLPILHGPMGELDVGRKSRAVPAAMRRALDRRDGGCCRFPGCENRRWVDAHHIVHWARGGETKLSNLVLLCGHHHRLVHEGGFSLARKADGELVFRRPDGEVVPALPSPARGDHAALRDRNRDAGVEIDPGALESLGRGEGYDEEWAIAGLLARGPGLCVSGKNYPLWPTSSPLDPTDLRFGSLRALPRGRAAERSPPSPS